MHTLSMTGKSAFYQSQYEQIPVFFWGGGYIPVHLRAFFLPTGSM